MKPGSLVRFKKPSTKDINKYYLVLEIDGEWVRLDGKSKNLLHHEKDLEIVSGA